jgi:peptide/nickel transport system permease protein
MYVGFKFLGADIGGLFSLEYVQAPWGIGRVWDLMKHLWLPAVVLGTAGTAAGIRILRANLLDEIRKPYVLTARTRGLPEARLLLKYPLRVALNPAISTIGYLLPALVGGSVIVSVVLDLPTLGPVLLDALLGQDTQLAAIVLLLIGALTVVGTLISDLLLAWIDPRIRKGFEG